MSVKPIYLSGVAKNGLLEVALSGDGFNTESAGRASTLKP